jgi:autotransporter-associated beta strand protein
MTNAKHRLNTMSVHQLGKAFLAAVAVVAFAVAAPRAEAQTTAFWVGAAGPNWNSVNWNTSSSATANYTPVDGNLLRWGPSSAGGTSNNDFPDLSVGSVSLQNGPANIVLNGNRLTVTNFFSAFNAPNATVGLPLRSAAASNGVFNISVSSNNTLTLNGVISATNSDSFLQFSGGGTINVNGLNTFTGNVRLGSGTSVSVNINTLANKTRAQSLGQGDVEFGFQSGANEGGGSINYTGGATTTDKGFRIGRNNINYDSDPGVAFNNNGTGAVVWTGSQLLSSSIATNMVFNLGGTNTGNNDWQSVFADNSATRSVGITKKGAGKWILSGSNTYTGATSVEEGVLLVNGSLAAGSAVTVDSGAVFGGNGTVNGNLTLDSGALFSFIPGDTLALADTLAIDPSFGVASLRNSTGGVIDWASIANDTYTLMDTSFSFNSNTISNFGSTNAAPVAPGKTAYFEQGTNSLQLVVVPEPAVLGLAACGVALLGLAVWRRRRA